MNTPDLTAFVLLAVVLLIAAATDYKQGKIYNWLTLPADHAFDDLQQAALRAGWAFAPGEAFLSRPTRHKHLRLSFGSQTPANIRHGVEVLAGLIAARMQEQAPAGYDVRDWTPLV